MKTQSRLHTKKRFNKDSILKTFEPTCGYLSAITATNNQIGYLSSVLSSVEKFDSRLSNKDSILCTDSLISNRISSKFHVKSRESDLKDLTITNFKKYERDLTERMKYFSMFDSPEIFTTRRRLQKIFKNYFLNFNEDIDVGPGETYQSSNGHTSLLAKLCDIKHWTTTPNCLEDTCRLIYENKTLKQMARIHIGCVSSSDRTSLYDQYRSHPFIGYAVFSHLLQDRVLTVVTGSRGTTVPKNNATDRFINIEAMFPMILQRYVAHAIKRCLSSVNNSLSNIQGSGLLNSRVFCDRQEIHKHMISNPKYATIDFSNASDSVCVNVVEALFPQKVVHDLMTYRSKSVALDGEFELFKLSSMGNGFTFETMTALLLGACHVFTTDCSVYGDDVIIPNEYSTRFIKLCRSLGFRTNNKKTFINSRFRESCGAFYHDDCGYITSFDFGPISSYNDVITSINKLTIILNNNVMSESVFNALETTRNELLRFVPTSRLGPLPMNLDSQYENLGYYVFSEKALRKHRSCKSHRETYKRYVDKCSLIFDAYNWKSDDFLLVNVSEFKSRRVSVNETRHRTAINAVRIRSLRPTIEVVRGKGIWREPLAFVNIHTGRLYRINRLLLQQRDLRGRDADAGS